MPVVSRGVKKRIILVFNVKFIRRSSRRRETELLASLVIPILLVVSEGDLATTGISAGMEDCHGWLKIRESQLREQGQRTGTICSYVPVGSNYVWNSEEKIIK
ncbi:uncharacterized protein isoform X1 [Rhodnius prolixus]|uniref:uncharacterized protein isoform X1 n=1 Tax=Rhodnius prolixus TaxID=13249 RepID=UPI003D18F82E